MWGVGFTTCCVKGTISDWDVTQYTVEKQAGFFLQTIVHLLVDRVPKSHGRTVMRPRKSFLTLRKILRFACANYKFMHFTLFTVFFSLFFTHTKWFLVIFFNVFLCKISKLKFWPRKKSTFRMSAGITLMFPGLSLITCIKIN